MGGDGKGKGADHNALRDLGGLPSQEEEATAKAKAAAKGEHKGDAKKARLSIEGIDNFDAEDDVLIPPLQHEIPRRFALVTWAGTASVIYDRIDAALTASAKYGTQRTVSLLCMVTGMLAALCGITKTYMKENLSLPNTAGDGDMDNVDKGSTNTLVDRNLVYFANVNAGWLSKLCGFAKEGETYTLQYRPPCRLAVVDDPAPGTAFDPADVGTFQNRLRLRDNLRLYAILALTPFEITVMLWCWLSNIDMGNMVTICLATCIGDDVANVAVWRRRYAWLSRIYNARIAPGMVEFVQRVAERFRDWNALVTNPRALRFAPEFYLFTETQVSNLMAEALRGESALTGIKTVALNALNIAFELIFVYVLYILVPDGSFDINNVQALPRAGRIRCGLVLDKYFARTFTYFPSFVIYRQEDYDEAVRNFISQFHLYQLPLVCRYNAALPDGWLTTVLVKQRRRAERFGVTI